MSFSCPNFDMEREYCLKVQAACVPGRLGCVLRHNSVFAIPAEERLREKHDRAACEDRPLDGEERSARE